MLDPYSRPTLGGREAISAPHGSGYAPQAQSGFAPQAQSNHAPQAQSYAPQFDPYVPPSQAVQNYGAPQGYAPTPAPSPSQELSSLQRGGPRDVANGYLPELRGTQFDHPVHDDGQGQSAGYAPQSYDQWSPPGYQSASAAMADPRGYDLGGYAPTASEPAGYETAGYRPQATLEPAHAEWGSADGPYDPYQQPQGYGQPMARDDGHEHGQPSAGQLEPANYQHDEAAEYEIEEPKGRSWGLIAAALVGAIAVGAGATYGYRLLTGPQAAVATPVIKNNAAPAKVKPAEPGGKQFAHTDSKIMGRLNEQSAAAAAPVAVAAPAAEADAGGTRKVQTVVIGRDGTIVPPPPQPEVAKVAAATPQPVNVPGMTIVDGFGGRPPAAAIAAPPSPAPAAPPAAARPVVVSPPPAAPAAAAPPAKPVTVAKAPPPAAAIAPAAPIAKAPVPKKAPVAAAPAPTGGNGFVAVLASVPASQKSSMDALKQFADMQQKYGPALANKTPEVREANLGDKGTYHRLLVGPPGSREQAGQLCSQLKAQGYGSCWVTAY
jgi:hypothetical protein